jgi:hypothetical protein
MADNSNRIVVNLTTNNVVVNDTDNNQLTVVQPVTDIIQVNSPGPQGIQGVTGAIPGTGTVISFVNTTVYNEWDAPATGSLTNDLTGAQIGVVQKIYHNHTIAPSVPATWVVVSNGIYVPNTLNIIYAEWVKGTRVEYWITQ